MKRSRLALITVFLALGACISGCAPVAPWQRGNLAKPQMALDTNPMLSTLRSHNYNSREAASGGSSAGGGGCGCY
jgi:hypothetical protein